MEEIFSIVGSENEEIFLEKLKSLDLRNLPKLRSFTYDEEEVGSTCDEERQMKDSLMPLFDGKVKFHNLKTISLCEINLKYVFSSSTLGSFVQLQRLWIDHCTVLEEIIRIDHDLKNNVELPSLEKLESLDLRNLPKLRSFTYDEEEVGSTSDEERQMKDTLMPLFDGKVKFRNLKTVRLWEINLKYVFSSSTLGSFVQLQRLEIRNCTVLEEIIRIDHDLKNNLWNILKQVIYTLIAMFMDMGKSEQSLVNLFTLQNKLENGDFPPQLVEKSGLTVEAPIHEIRVTEAYLWMVIMYFEPHYSHARLILCKITMMFSVVDDTYDYFASLEDWKTLNCSPMQFRGSNNLSRPEVGSQVAFLAPNHASPYHHLPAVPFHIDLGVSDSSRVSHQPSQAPTQNTGSTHPMTTRLRSWVIKHKVFSSVYKSDSSVSAEVEPKTVAKALASPKWHKAMLEEYDALMRNQT
ncbi:hypothetical protein LWI29_014813 [Acer saccharum]|uniref:Uncharacterized protein n=1 Tax=Acer saccharum TaxID=4024 RepID=A0AA39SSI8_ACESA|nr:hypothetical protein LWI29_014813 [Acer saccharum]